VTRVTGATEGTDPANEGRSGVRRRTAAIAPDITTAARPPSSAGAAPTDAHVEGEADVLGSWTATVIHALHQCGVDGTALATEAGIDVEGLDDPDRRVPLHQSTRLWHLAAEATGDPCVGLQVARHVRPGTFHGLSVGVVSSPSFRDALERMVRFGRVVLNPTGHADLTEVDGTLRWTLWWAPGTTPPSHESMEAILASMVRAARFLMDRDLRLDEVELTRPVRPESSRFERFFGCPVRYGSDRYLLAFPVEPADRALPTGCDDAARGADDVVQAYLERAAPAESVTDHVRAQVVVLLEQQADVSAASVAAALAMSSRTMQRRLREEGTAFRDLVADVRVELAKRAVASGTESIEAIADRLGFSDASAFRRAFKRRTGVSPRSFASGARP
jgi:AraC-like DNA-binding protein